MMKKHLSDATFVILALHIQAVHEKKKHNECNVCNATFSKQSNLNNHILGVHEGNQLFKFSNCAMCFSLFAKKAKILICHA